MSRTLPSHVTPDGITVGLTGTSSMPCASWSLPAERSCPASKASIVKLGDDAVCKLCYAGRGFYRMSNVQAAQGARYQWVLESMIADGGEDFVVGMVTMIRADVDKRGEPIFRVHDSGDLFSAPYALLWGRIADAMPDVQFWIPTRSHTLPRLLDAIRELASRPNVEVRPSALAFDAMPPVIAGLAAGTTVIRSLPVLDTMPHVRLCPKTDPRLNRSSCDGDDTDEPCRACWEGSEPIAYFEH